MRIGGSTPGKLAIGEFSFMHGTTCGAVYGMAGGDACYGVSADGETNSCSDVDGSRFVGGGTCFISGLPSVIVGAAEMMLCVRLIIIFLCSGFVTLEQL